MDVMSERADVHVLSKEVADLREKNRTLIAQLSDIGKIQDEIKDVCAKNSVLEDKNRCLQAKYDDIYRRLQICLQGKQDAQPEAKKSESVIDLTRIKTEYSQKIEEYKAKISQMEAQIRDFQEVARSKANYEMQLQSLVVAATTHFGVPISSAESLLSALSATSADREKSSEQNLLKQLHNLGKKYKKACNNAESAEKEREDAMRKAKVFEDELNQARQRISDLTVTNRTQKETIGSLSHELQSVQVQISELKAKAIFNSDEKSSEISKDLQSATQKALFLENELRSEQSKNKKLKLELTKSLRKLSLLSKMKKKLIEARKANLALCQVNAELKNSAESLETSLKSSAMSESKLKADCDMLRGELSKAELEIQAAKRETLDKLNSAKEDRTEEFRKEKEEQQKRIEELVAIIDRMRKNEADISQRYDRGTKAEELPASVWCSSTLPTDLSEMVEQISRNMAIGTSAKVKAVIKTVTNWYKSEYDKLQTKLNESEAKYEGLCKKIDEISSGIGVNCSERTDSLDKISQILSSAEIQLKEVSQKKSELEGSLVNIMVALGVNTVESATNSVKSLIECSDALGQKYKDLKASEKATKASERGLNEKIAAIEKEAQLLQKENSELTKKVSELQIRSEEQSRDQISSITRNKEAQTKVLESLLVSTDEKLQKMRKMQSELQAEISRLHKENSSVKEKMENEREKFSKAAKRLKQKCRKVKEVDAVTPKVDVKPAEVDESIEEMKDELEKLKAECKSEALRNQMLTEELDRANKLAETRIRSANMKSELEFSNQLSELRSKIELAKRDLMSQVIAIFPSFFDTSQPINDESFGLFVQSLRKKVDEMAGQASKVRSLLGIHQSESVDSALAGLILKSCAEVE